LLAVFVQSRGLAAPTLAAGVGALAAVSGVWLTGAGRKAQGVPRVVLPFSAGVLLGVALFGLLPELAGQAGWVRSLVLFGFGFGILVLVDRYVYPVCPTCAHDHDHHACHEEFHGFAAPLLAAASIHSFLDGWSMATVQQVTPLGLRVAVPLAVTLHKIPEGIALGGILCAAIGPRPLALGATVLAEAFTLLGAGIGLLLAPRLGTTWTLYPLGLTAGWIFYLGFHAVHEEWKRCGATPAFVSALTGVAGAAALQRGAEALFR
jgi:zinc transporter ZupT